MSMLYVVALFLVFAVIFYFVRTPDRRAAGITSSERTRQLRKLQIVLANPEVQIVIERMINDIPPEIPDSASSSRKKLKYDLLHTKLRCLIDDQQIREQVYLIIRKRMNSGVY